MQYSPWGHQVQPLEGPVSLIEDTKKNYNLVPFSAGWPFLTRTRKTERTLAYDSHGIMANAYDPVRVDKFLFRRDADYFSMLREVREWADGADALAQELAAQENGSALAAWVDGEADIARKFTVQRYTRPFWYLGNFASSQRHVTSLQRSILYAWLEGAKGRILSAGGPRTLVPLDALADPLETNAGSPLFMSGPSAKNIIAQRLAGAGRSLLSKEVRPLSNLSGIELPVATVDAIERDAARTGLDPLMYLAVGANKRSGPSRKPYGIYHQDFNDVRANQQATNVPRTRRVFMVPYWFNVLLAPLLRVTKAVRKATPGLWPDPAALSRLMQSTFKGRAVAFRETDVSALDNNMSLEHRQLIAEALADVFPEWLGAGVVQLLRITPFLPYAVPDPLGRVGAESSGLLCIPKSPTGLYSGFKLTSDEDSFYCIWMTLTALVLEGTITVKQVKDWTFSVKGAPLIFNSGDDILIARPANMHPVLRNITKVGKDLFGVDVKDAEGDRFLMRHYLSDGSTISNYPVLARIIQQTLSNETIPEDELIMKIGWHSRVTGWAEEKEVINRIASKSKFSKQVAAYIAGAEALLTSSKSGTYFSETINWTTAQHIGAIRVIGTKLAARGDLITFILEEASQKFDSAWTQEARALVEVLGLRKMYAGVLSKQLSLFLQNAKLLGIPTSLL